MTPDRSDGGEFTATVPDTELLAAVRDHAPAATSEVAGAVDMTRQGADYRLRQLRDAGRVESKKIGASLVWFTVDDAGSGGDSNSTVSAEETQSPAGGDGAETGAWPVVERVASDEWEDTPERLEQRQAAARAALDYVAANAPVSKTDAQSELLPEYAVDGQDERTWWRRTVRPVLKEAGTYDNSARGYRLTGGVTGERGE